VLDLYSAKPDSAKDGSLVCLVQVRVGLNP